MIKKELSEKDIKQLRELRFWLFTLSALSFGACALYPLHGMEWLSQLGGGVLFISLLSAISIDVKLPREKQIEVDYFGGNTEIKETEEEKEKEVKLCLR
nr:hypothetical protein [uncultured Pseudogulbenkiania sp.]